MKSEPRPLTRQPLGAGESHISCGSGGWDFHTFPWPLNAGTSQLHTLLGLLGRDFTHFSGLWGFWDFIHVSGLQL